VVHKQLKRVRAQPKAAAVRARGLGKWAHVQVLRQRDRLQLEQLLAAHAARAAAHLHQPPPA
jgi:hypothetical protein